MVKELATVVLYATPQPERKILKLFGYKIIDKNVHIYTYLFGLLWNFQHCTAHIRTGSWKGRGNQYIQFVRVLYCKLLTNAVA